MRWRCCLRAQVDGGLTYTEPTAIISGSVEGQEDVSSACGGAPRHAPAPALAPGALPRMLCSPRLTLHHHTARAQVAVRVHDACFTSGARWRARRAHPRARTACMRAHAAQPRASSTRTLPALPAEVLGSLKCDCADQLNLALERIVQEPPGMVVYLQQEGRGIGLANKIAAYSLQARRRPRACAHGRSCAPRVRLCDVLGRPLRWQGARGG